VEGIARLHELVARHSGEELDAARVVVGIETDRCSWVQALIAPGYQVYAVNARQAARFKERYASSGAKSDKGDAHALADVVRIDRAQLRPVAGATRPRPSKSFAPTHQIAEMEGQVKAHFLAHPDAEIHLWMPGIAEITGARVLAEFADGTRHACAKARMNVGRHQPRHPDLRQEPQRPSPLRRQQPARRRLFRPRRSPPCVPHPAPAPAPTSSAPAPATTPP
jgi:transposase